MRTFTLCALTLVGALTIVCPAISQAAGEIEFGTCCAKAEVDTWSGRLGERFRDAAFQGGIDVLFFDVYANHGVGGTGSDFFVTV